MVQQRCLQRNVDDVGHPHRVPEQLRGQRQPGRVRRPSRRRMDEAAGAVERRPEVRARARATIVEMRVQPGGEGHGPRDVLIDDHEVCRAQAEHGVGAGRSGPASADQDNAREVRRRQGAPEPPAPARAIGVVPDESIAPANDGVHRADGLRLLGQLIEQRNHRLLARDAGPGSPSRPHGGCDHDSQGRGPGSSRDGRLTPAEKAL